MPEGWRFRRGLFGRMILQVREERHRDPSYGNGGDIETYYVWVDADVMDAVDFALTLADKEPAQ